MRKKSMKPTVWQALNQPVMEIPEQTGKEIVAVAAVIMLAAWIVPHWGSALRITNYELSMGNVAGYEETVAGAVIEAPQVPDWYYTVTATSDSVVTAYTAAAVEVLDVSEPVGELAAYLEPGTDAVWNAWLELMADPEF